MPEHFDKKSGYRKILEAYNKYVKSGGTHREHLEYIQHIVDKVGEKFVLVIPKTKGGHKDVPYRVTFQPRKTLEQIIKP